MTTTTTEQPAVQAPAAPGIDIRHLSTAQLQALGVSQLAYVKPVMVGGVAAFAIHAADGTQMAVAEDCAVAVAAIREHEMVAALVH